MFLIAALGMVLCPTQCGRLSAGTIYACTLGMQSRQYDWCKLVYDFFIERAKVFCRDFYTYGWTKGVGACTMFLVILYLDRLDKIPVQWGIFPRLKAWDMKEILEAKRAYRESGKKGDYGVLGCVVVAYEKHNIRGPPRTVMVLCEEVYIPVMDNEILRLKQRKKGNSERIPMKMRQMAKERAKKNSVKLERFELDMDTVNEEAIITPPPPRPESLSERCQQVTSSPPPQHKVTPPLPSPKVTPPQPNVTSPLRPPPQPKVTSPLRPPSLPKVTSPLPPPSPPKVTSPLPPPSPPKVTSPLPPPSPPKVTSPLPQSQANSTSPLPPPPLPKVNSSLPPPSQPKATSPLPHPSPPKVTSPLPHPSPPKVTSPLPPPSPPQFTLPRSPQLCVDPIGGANLEAVVNELMESPLPGSLDREKGKAIVCGLSAVPLGHDIDCDNKMDGLLASSALLFQRSRPRRGRKKRVALADRGRGWFTSEIKKFSYNLVEFVNHNGGLLSGRGNLKGLSLNVMIKCGDGSNCNMHQCKGVAQLNGYVHKQYVDTVAKLYNSMWASKYLGRSMRYMLTSVFSEKVMKFVADCRDGVHNSAVDRSRLANWMSKEREKMKVASHLGEEDQHTETGTVFSRISELIGVDKLLFGGEDGDGWGELLSRKRRRMDIDIQKDTHSCGVRMLLAIKDFAEGYESLSITDLEEARRLLLTQDILSPFNLERDRIKELVNGANMKKL
ncbi:uncharacterized protein [Spinacia oleracea]|uniref:Uncharacterized protein isoform X2 n=1 Tax=Spinacia oleracea TaxID=3562 RepID=A0ABM3R5U8_SPIOL|nr:uncharacterized protein LOC110778216 isoform X2 [Spinacia oleracea]